jgi:TolB-like protein
VSPDMTNMLAARQHGAPGRYPSRLSRTAVPSLAILLGALFFGMTPAARAQDLRPIASTIASRISTSNHKTLAVVDFTDLEGNVTKLGRFLAEELSVDLVEEAKGFDVIDRTHLKALLQEHQLSATGLIDPLTARKLGKIAGADALVTGTLTPFGDSIRLSVKVLDTETAKMLAASTTEVPKTPALAALIGDVTSSSRTSASPPADQPPSPAAAAAEISVDQNALLFAVRKCQRSGNLLSCSGYIKNKADKRRTVNPVGNNSPVVVDELGDQYTSGYNKFRFGGSMFGQELEPDLPVNFSFSVEDVNPAATHATVIFAGWVQNEGNFKVTLRNVPIQKE